MSSEKIVFHPLERLDLIDVDALQAQVLTYLQRVAGNTVNGSGLISTPSYTVTNGVGNAYSIEFSDFVLMTKQDDAAAFSSSSVGQVVCFDSANSLQGLCDFALARTLVQNKTDQTVPATLPYQPSDGVNYSEALDGQYYPYIWARAVEVDDAQSVRRFWSVANGQEVTDSVVTRNRVVLNFLVQTAEPSANLGTGWVKMARIVQWDLVGGVVQLSANNIIPIYLSDDVIPLNGRANGSENFHDQSGLYTTAELEGGVAGMLKTLKRDIEIIRSVGVEDGLYGVSGSDRRTAPSLSMDGLYDAISTIQADMVNLRVLGSAMLNVEVEGLGADTITVDIDNMPATANRNYVQLGMGQDFRVMFLNGAASYTPSTWLNNVTSTNLKYITSASTNFYVSVPQQYVGYGMRVNLVPVAATNDDINNSITVDLAYTYPNSSNMSALSTVLLKDNSDDNSDDIFFIRQREYYDNLNQPQTFTGFKFALGGVDGLLTTSIAQRKIKFSVKIELELIKP